MPIPPKRRYECIFCKHCFQARVHLFRHLRAHTKESPYSCPKCGISIRRKHTLLYHLTTHENEGNKFQCDVCSKAFYSRWRLARHQESHAEKVHKCSRCDDRFRGSFELKSHVARRHERKPFPCVLCGKGYMTKTELENHLRVHTGEKPFSCESCGKSFHSSRSLTQHKKKHGERNLKCKHCPKSFFNGRYLKDHNYRLHSDVVKKFVCDVCNRSFLFKYELSRHQTVHSNRKPFECSQCLQRFKDKNYLAIHVKNIHGRKEGATFPCPQCPMVLLRAETLQRHIGQRHTGVRPFHCIFCPFRAKLKKTLLAHIPLHTGEKPYFCDLCESSYAHKNGLEDHTRSQHNTMHSPNKIFLQIHAKMPIAKRRYECIFCNLHSFRSREHLFRHLRAHTKESPYSCHKCGISLRRKHTYLHHLTTHEGTEGTFPCDVCSKAFYSRWSLTLHQKIHVEKLHKCFRCDKSFARLVYLRKHVANHWKGFATTAITTTGNHDKPVESRAGDKSFLCESCGKGFGSYSHLDRHKKTHEARIKEFTCNSCPKAFFSETQRKSHFSRVHSDLTKSFGCQSCQWMFHSTWELKKHQLTHSDHRPYPCSQCQQRFKSAWSLARHVKRVHGRNGTFQCPKCPQIETNSTTLKRHVQQRHSELRTYYKCLFCPFRTEFKWSLPKHIHAHTREQPYFCDFCERCYSRKSKLDEHFRFRHMV